MTARVVHVNDQVAGAVYIGRAYPRGRLSASPWANPYHIGPGSSRLIVLARYRDYVLSSPLLLDLLPALRGLPLACWCRHDGDLRPGASRCHGDVLIGLLDRYSDKELHTMTQSLQGDPPASADGAEREPGVAALHGQLLITQELVSRLQALNAGGLRGRSLSLAITEIETGSLWLARALTEAQGAST